MESEPTRGLGMEAIACSAEEGDTRHNSTRNSVLPAHSMENVRLSDALVTPSKDCASQKEDVAANMPTEDDSISSSETAVSDDDSTIAGDTAIDQHNMQLSVERRGSEASTMSLAGEGSGLTTRSRSTSSGTLSSTNSLQVDWEELEKSEEQAPRDEGSDEVRTARQR